MTIRKGGGSASRTKVAKKKGLAIYSNMKDRKGVDFGNRKSLGDGGSRTGLAKKEGGIQQIHQPTRSNNHAP